ncbi:Uncharacterised protein [Serratia rubidaea]|uniref:Uncharacterized protein n=1 Tax=Serratia rubidaea TaxID=61652 RepID=A0A4U9H9S9_SERRU|nr:Uncharacterised protein [Serratia rubidaea]
MSSEAVFIQVGALAEGFAPTAIPCAGRTIWPGRR